VHGVLDGTTDAARRGALLGGDDRRVRFAAAVDAAPAETDVAPVGAGAGRSGVASGHEHDRHGTVLDERGGDAADYHSLGSTGTLVADVDGVVVVLVDELEQADADPRSGLAALVYLQHDHLHGDVAPGVDLPGDLVDDVVDLVDRVGVAAVLVDDVGHVDGSVLQNGLLDRERERPTARFPAVECDEIAHTRVSRAAVKYPRPRAGATVLRPASVTSCCGLEGQSRMHAHGPIDRAEKVAKLLDEAITIPIIGLKIGIDPLLNYLPFPIGDIISGVIGYYIVLEGILAKVPWHVLGLMFTLATIDLLIGFIPIPLIDGAIDAAWKANKWNVTLMKRFARNP